MEEERLSPQSEDPGPIPWLLAFANLGFDDGKPRPPRDRALHSRFLGLDDRHRGYAFDEDGARPEIRDGYLPGLGECEVRTQEFRGVVKRWIRLPGEAAWTPSPPRDAAITPHAFRRFLVECPPRSALTLANRAITPDRVGWFQYGCTADLEYEATAEEHQAFFEALEKLRGLVRRRLLEPLWILHVLRPRAEEAVSESEASMHGNLARWVLRYLVLYCVRGWDDAAAREPVEDASDAVGNPIGYTEGQIEGTIWEHRAPVYLEVRPSGRMHWDAIGFPGLVCAEALNACFAWPDLDVIGWPDPDGERSADPRWSGLRCCSWCAAFFWETPGRAGRPRAFCTTRCRASYHAYGPGDQRKPIRIRGILRK